MAGHVTVMARQGGDDVDAEERLERYRRKRDFEATDEPSGGASDGTEPSAGPRFLVQEHHASHLHWDFRLEHDGVLVSWALPRGVPMSPAEDALAIHVEDHPLSYFGFEGTIPEGSYGAGTVERWDSGTYEEHEFRDGKVEVTLHGRRLHGRYALFRTDRRRGRDEWRIHRMDPPPEGWEPLPEVLAPMMAQLSTLPDEDDGWAWEVKWDGIRALAFVQGGRVRLQSRNLLDLTDRYPELRAMGAQLGSRQCLLDGEIVALDERGRPSFERLQRRMSVTDERLLRRRIEEVPIVYMAFDLLHLDGRSLTAEPYVERRRLLDGLHLEGPAWKVPSHSVGQGRQLLDASRELGLEGLVGKRLQSRYQPGRRSATWRKVKNQLERDFVVCGFTRSSGAGPPAVAGVLVAYHRPGGDGTLDLVYAGKVRTGFSDQQRRELYGILAPLALPAGETPLDEGRPSDASATLVQPRVVCTVAFLEWTRSGRLRHATWRGIREGVSPARVVRGEPDGSGTAVAHESAVDRQLAVRALAERGVAMSSPDKVWFPDAGTTKADLLAYLVDVAPVALPHLRHRAFTLKRFPEGVGGPHFFEKRAPAHTPDWIARVAQPSMRSGDDVRFAILEDLPAIVWAANLGAYEWHVHLSDASDLGTPLVVVFDLDPGAGTGLRECCDVALLVREVVAAAGLLCRAKTSGSKGIHVYVPINDPSATFQQSKAFAQAVARLLEKQHPRLVTSAMGKQHRRGRVFVDWNQNEPHKSTVAPYSVRAVPEAYVSTPLTWDEVVRGAESDEGADALRFGMPAVLARIAEHGDLFEPVLTTSQRLP